MANQGVADFL